MKNIIALAVKIPDEFSHLVDAKVPTYISNVVLAMALVTLAVIIAYIVLTRKKYNWVMSGLLGGVAVYFLFSYYLLNFCFQIIGITPFADNMYVYSIVCSLACSGLMLGGRLLIMKFFRTKTTDFKGNLSFGVGIMCTEGVFMIIQLMTVYLSCAVLNSTGITELLTEEMDEASIVSLMETVQSMMEYKVTDFIFLAVAGIVYMSFHIFATAPIFAATEEKVSKGWYAIVFAFMAVLKCIEYISYQVEVSPLIFAVFMLVVGATAVYLFYKLYLTHYKSEEGKKDEPTNNHRGGYGGFGRNAKTQQPPKKMPKFDNLSKL